MSETLAGLVWEALTGQSDAPLTVGGTTVRVDEVAARLGAAGWDRQRLAEHAAGERSAGRTWPKPIPVTRRGGIGAAQLAAAIRAVRERLGPVEEVRLRDSTQPLGVADRALLAERPPHHGSVG